MSNNYRHLIERFLVHWNQGDYTDFSEIYHADFEFCMPGTASCLGIMEYEEWIDSMRGAYPDLQIVIYDELTTDNKIALQWQFTGTNEGKLRHSPAAHKRVALPGMTLFHLLDGQIWRGQWFYDVIAVYRQLGRTPSIFLDTA